MSSFYSPDPNLIINALRFLLESYKLYRARRGQQVPEKQEEVLEETVTKAEELSATGASPEKVASEIANNLERDLGVAAKDEIIRQASSLLLVAQPFELEAFQYYEHLVQILKRAQDFCASANIFQLRSATNGKFSVLPMPRLNTAIQEVTENFAFLCGSLQRVRDVIKTTPSQVATYLSTEPSALHVKLALNLTRARSAGGTYVDTMVAVLVLASGSEVNRIGFDISRPAESPFLEDFDIRLTGKEFQQIVSAILDDVNHYTTELAGEQRDFKERLGPQLSAVLGNWMKK